MLFTGKKQQNETKRFPILSLVDLGGTNKRE
ncbi:hypothetical protein AND4_13918 [Vibrio sp. AND4]|nr:hypothetical protein AND4_13918 [Vibrio sp. AND4]